jgi:sodium-coupled neutral amino acid transporter 10
LIYLLIFSQVFEIYESLPDPSLQHMNEVVKSAVNICSGVYIAVGLFGNIACSGLELGGQRLQSIFVFVLRGK